MDSINFPEAIRQLEEVFANCHQMSHDEILKEAASALVKVIGIDRFSIYQRKEEGDEMILVDALPKRSDIESLKKLKRHISDLCGERFRLGAGEITIRVSPFQTEHWIVIAFKIEPIMIPSLEGLVAYFVSRLEDCLEEKFLEERKQYLVNSHHSNIEAIQLFSRTVELGATLTRCAEMSLFLNDQKSNKLVLVATTGEIEVGVNCSSEWIVNLYTEKSKLKVERFGNSIAYRISDSGQYEHQETIGFIEICYTEEPKESTYRSVARFLDFASPFIVDAAKQTTLYPSFGRRFSIQGIESFLAELLKVITTPLRLSSGCLMLLRDNNKKLSLISMLSDGNQKEVTFHYTRDQKSIANRILETKEVFHTDDVEGSKEEFNVAGIDALGINGAFIGVPLVNGEDSIGVMSFWANGLERHLGNYLQPFARLLSQLLTGKSEAEFLQRQNKYRTSLKTKFVTNQDFSWLCDVIMFGVLASGVDRARIFAITEQNTKKRCLAAFGHGPSPSFAGDVFDLVGCRYIQHFKSNVFFDRSPRHYSSIDFGQHPMQETLGMSADLPWMVIPLVLNGKVFGFLEVDNKLSEKSLKGEVASLLDLTCRLASRLVDFNRQVDDADRAYKLLDAIPTCVWEKNRNHEFVFVNAYFSMQLGRKTADIIRRKDSDLFPMDLCKRYREGDEYVLENNLIYHATEEFENQKGERKTIEVFKSPKLSIHGEVIGTMGIWFDATELRKANADLEKTRDLLERAQVMAGMGSWEWNVTEKKVFPSQGLYDLFGIKKEEGKPGRTSDFVSAIKDQVGFFMSLMPLVGEEIWDIIEDNVPIDRIMAVSEELMNRLPPGFDFADSKVGHAGKTIEVTLKIEKEGKERTILAKCAPVEKNQDTVFDAIAIDITQQNEELQLREDLINEIHHRMRNNVIVLQEIIEAKIEEIECLNENYALVKCLASITAAGEVHEMLYEGRKTNINLQRYLNRLCERLVDVYGGDEIRVQVECSENANSLELNPGRANAFGLVLVELVSNSVKHSLSRMSPDLKREIHIKVGLIENDKVQVVYADSGKGFQKLIDLNVASGLSMAQRFVVSRLKGRITFPRLNGSQIEITFPL